MESKEFKLSEKNFNSIKELSDKDFGALVKAVCTYAFYNKEEKPTDKVLRVYFEVFKERIDRSNYFRAKGILGGIKSKEQKEKTDENRSMIFDIYKVGSLDELFKVMLKGAAQNCKTNYKKEE